MKNSYKDRHLWLKESCKFQSMYGRALLLGQPGGIIPGDKYLPRPKERKTKKPKRERKDTGNQRPLSKQDLFEEFLKDRQNLLKNYFIMAQKVYKNYLNDAHNIIRENH